MHPENNLPSSLPGSLQSEQGADKQNPFARLIVLGLFSLSFCIVGAWALRATVASVGRSVADNVESAPVDLTPVSAESARQAGRARADQFREEMIAKERRWAQEREHARWVERTQPRPGTHEARRVWRAEVDTIEKQLQDAKALQDELGPDGPLAEGTILWHRQKYLEKLRADAPSAI